MPAWICVTCGLEHADTPEPPVEDCAICSDERQYFWPEGQLWTTLEELQQDRNGTVFEVEPNLYGITIEPKIGIGHRSLLVRTPNGNVLWDAPAYFDEELAGKVRDLGGIAAIASSHPHLTGLSITWSHAFGGVPVWYGADDRKWVRKPDDVIRFWQGTQVVLPGVTLVQCGGHYPGSAVLHWEEGADGRGVALSGDTFMVVADREHVTFMRSFPNMIPLPQRSVQKIVDALAPWSFNRAYSGFVPGLLDGNADEKVRTSAARYIQWIRDDVRDPDERVD